MDTVASAKLRSLSTWKSITGCFWRSSQTTTPIRQTTVRMAKVTMKFEENQSLRWPSSSTISSEPEAEGEQAEAHVVHLETFTEATCAPGRADRAPARRSAPARGCPPGD